MKDKDKRGQILVEAVMVLPIILVLLFASLDFAKIFVRQIEINFLAYNTARIMMVHSPDVGIVDKHMNEFSDLYKYINKNHLTKKIEDDNQTGLHYLVLDYKMHKTIKIVPWQGDLVRRAVAPFQMGDPNPRFIPYKWKGTTTANGEPAIKGFDQDFRKGMAKREGVVTSTSGTGLSSFLMKQWYPEKVNVGGVSFLEAAKWNFWGMLWWYGYLDKYTRKAIDAYMMMGYTPVGMGNDEWLSRKYTGFMHGKDRITYWGTATSPKPPIAWDEFGPSCENGWGGEYYAHSWTRQPADAWTRDDGAFYWAESHEICTDPVYDPWGDCLWCAHSEFTPVTHFMISHAGGNIWGNHRSYWNFYNAVWALANIPESYATATYRATYWNIEDDWFHGGWMDEAPSYRPDQVSGMAMSPIGFGSQSGMKEYANQIPKPDPKDEQNTIWHNANEGR